MQINKNIDGDKLELALSGRLDAVTAKQLDEEIRPLMENVKDFVMDFKELEYLSSAGLRVILAVQKQMNTKGSLVIKNVNDTIMEVFEITGFIDILTIE